MACPAGFILSRLPRMFCRVLSCVFALAFSAGGAEKTFDFTSTPVGKSPAGFTNILVGRGKPGEWKIVEDDVPSTFEPLSEKAPTTVRRAVLAQTGFDTTDERFPILLYNEETFGDFTLTTRFKLVEGVFEQMAGIVFRVKDADNFYVIRASGLGNNVRFYKVVAGQRTAPIGPEIKVSGKEWHELKIQCEGNKIRCWFNGRQPFPELTDNSFASGKIGFWTKSDSISHFTGTKITYTPRESYAEVLVRDALKENPRLLGLWIYVAGENGSTRVAASKETNDVGKPGGDAERDVLSNGQPYFGKDKDYSTVMLPLRDRNGEPMAAVKFRFRSFPGEIQQTTLSRALPIVKEMQVKVQTLEELTR